MTITRIGHSCFALMGKDNVTIVTDPYSDSIGVTMPRIVADIVTISHDHYDHNNVGALLGNPSVINQLGNYDIKGVNIYGVDSYHDAELGTKRGKNIIYCINLDGIKFCHLGDIGQAPTNEIINGIGKVDVLFIPVGGNYTIDASLAMEYISRINPKYVIPMHYRAKNVNINIESLDNFLSMWNKNDVIVKKNEVDFSCADFCGDNHTKVIYLEKD